MFVITGLGMGGAEKQVCSLADELYEKGHDISIVYFYGKRIVSPINDVEIIHLPVKFLSFSLIVSFIQFLKIINKLAPDVIHSHMYHANIISRIARLFVNIPKLITTAHSNNEGGRLRMLTYRLTNFLSDKFTNVSLMAVDDFIFKGAADINTISCVYNGIDTEVYKKELAIGRPKLVPQLANNEYVLLCVGRFSEAKDYPTLLKSIQLLINEKHNIHLLVVGDGELRPMVEGLISNYGLANYVSLLGNRGDISELMNYADCFILPSKYEGFGLVLAEAMSCETLVISTNSGGPKEILSDYGFLIPSESPSLMSNEIIKVMGLKSEEYAFRVKKGRQYILDNFSIESIVEQWVEIYES